MQEIEVKYRVSDAFALLNALISEGIHLSAVVEQDDQAYAPEGWDYGQSKIGVSFPRLRTQAGRHLFTVKQPVDNELACIEHETEVVDREAMHHAVLAMGFYPTVRISKTRRTGTVGELSLCVDHVESIGCFLEVEKIAGPGEIGIEVQRELDNFVRSLGVEAERISQTYDSLIRQATATTA